MLACDGANSAVRKAMMRNSDFQHEEKQFYVNYKELNIPADKNGLIQMERNWLHIWGREAGAFMMIALPNIDNSFTCTIFMPIAGEKSIEALDTEEKMKAFFEKYFPDAMPLMPTLAKPSDISIARSLRPPRVLAKPLTINGLVASKPKPTMCTVSLAKVTEISVPVK